MAVRFNVHMFFWSCTLTFCALFWVSVVGCISTTMRDVPNVMMQLKRDAITPEQMTPLLGVSMLPEVEFTTGRFGSVHVHHMPEVADLDGGLPIMQRPIVRPIVNRPWTMAWVTNYVEPRPDVQTALLVSLKPPGDPQPIYGSNGSMLQVPPNYVLVPKRVEDEELGDRPPVPFEFVQNQQGVVMLRVRWPEVLVGMTVWCQLLVADDRVPAGCVSTPMLEIHVGEH